MIRSLRLVAGLFLASVFFVSMALAESVAPVRLFILSGQSNMNNLNADKDFTPIVTLAFSNDTVVVIKNAVPGKPIQRWLLTDPAAGKPNAKKAKSGDLYVKLMNKVKPALTNRPVDTVVFLWLQGESDGMNNWGEFYGERLQALLAQLRTDVGRQDIGVVLARISDTKVGEPSWDAVRKAQEQAAEADPLMVLVDTDDLNGKGGMHYNGPGYRLLGARLAEQAIALTHQLDAGR